MENLDSIERNLYLRKLALGEIEGQKQGKPSLDKPWLAVYSEEAIKKPKPYMSAYRYLLLSNANNTAANAIEYFGVHVTYEELFDKINQIGAAFESLGIKQGDVVPICCANTPEIIYIFYALSKIGAVADIIDPRINESVMEKYLNNIDAKIFMCLDLSLPKYYNLMEKQGIEKVISLPILQTLPVPMRAFAKAKQKLDEKIKGIPAMPNIKLPDDPKYISFTEFEKLGKNKNSSEAKYEKDRPVAIIHTGGTTGISKGAVLSNDNLNSLVHQFRLTDLDLNNGQRWLNLMPPCVAYGLANGIHLSLCSGMESILIPTYEPEKIDDMILKYKPNRLACSPAHWEYFARSEKLKGKDLSFLKHPIEGGDSINPRLERQINEILHNQGCKDNLRKGYGLSETCAALCVASPKADPESLISSVGFPLVNTVMGIFDPDTGEELGYNEVGEICASSDNVMLGYLNRPVENANTLKVHADGRRWIHTADLGLITEDGRVFVKGRIKKIIIRFDGTKVYPADIENAIASHPAVALNAVVGVRDSEYEQGELPKAYIVLKPEYKGNKEVINQIARICEENLIDYMIPFDYEEIPDMPYTAVGKVDFMKLKSYQTETQMDKGIARTRK